ncbi:unnamed protein product [Phytophthora lilii]|uniref:Unnamed protein product n=1 Tax=Phytophthora lilii TaxID=2077276 RepID=A0A9W6YI12_9STRA|nr:unnamed protein product [Phytophthora lilii]
MVRFVKLTHRRPLLTRLGTSDSTIFKIRELQLLLDDVAAKLDVVDMPSWQDHWSTACELHRSTLVDMVSRADSRMLVNELRADQVEEVLRTLHASLRSSEVPLLTDCVRETYDRIAKFSRMEGLQMFDWYIPRQNVTVGDHIGSGTFGTVSHGMLSYGGSEKKVIVKELHKELANDSSSSGLFLDQLQFWDGLMKNEKIPKTHILSLIGGHHLGSPKLYVCEDAVNGDLLTFLGKAENQSLFFPMFLQVTEALMILHSNDIVHGALKCNNILIGKDNVVKLSDFGFSYIRSLSVELSSNKDKAMADAVRWKAKEMLEETADPELRYTADIYSLGMCMIEAITQAPPFEMCDDDEVMAMIMSGAGHPRPDNVPDETWDLISDLCNADCRQRPTLDQVVQRMTELSLSERGSKGAENDIDPEVLPEAESDSQNQAGICPECDFAEVQR